MRKLHPFLEGLTPEDQIEGWKASDWFTSAGDNDVEAWRVQFDREIDLPPHILERMDKEAYDSQAGLYDLPKFILLVREVYPDIKVERWRHMPLPIFVQGVYLPPKIFEMVDAMSLREAIEAARQTWKEQYGHLPGVQSAIFKARLATKKDFKKMAEIPTAPEPEEGGESPVCKKCGQAIDAGDQAWVGTDSDRFPIHESCPPRSEEVSSLIVP